MGLVQTVFGADVLEECIAAPKLFAALRTRVLSRHVRQIYVGRRSDGQNDQRADFVNYEKKVSRKTKRKTKKRGFVFLFVKDIWSRS